MLFTANKYSFYNLSDTTIQQKILVKIMQQKKQQQQQNKTLNLKRGLHAAFSLANQESMVGKIMLQYSMV